MAKKISVDEALELYHDKKSKNQKTSWGIFKKRMTPKDYQVFKYKAENLYDKPDDWI